LCRKEEQLRADARDADTTYLGEAPPCVVESALKHVPYDDLSRKRGIAIRCIEGPSIARCWQKTSAPIEEKQSGSVLLLVPDRKISRGTRAYSHD
jgi:hypothetical protein